MILSSPSAYYFSSLLYIPVSKIIKMMLISHSDASLWRVNLSPFHFQASQNLTRLAISSWATGQFWSNFVTLASSCLVIKASCYSTSLGKYIHIFPSKKLPWANCQAAKYWVGGGTFQAKWQCLLTWSYFAVFKIILPICFNTGYEQ